MSETNYIFKHHPLSANLTLKNKLLMAPMTRCMADEQGVPTAAMAEYYARRADAGLIITEGTIIRPDGRGYPNVPGIYSQAQLKGWQEVTAAVHEKNGLIFLQIWHVGRVSHPYYLNGQLPLSASATQMTGRIKRNEGLIYGKSRAATLAEISELIQSYANAANNALAAGFDGIEIHGANGYLIDQFLHFHTNSRADEFGSTPENMARFALEVVNACGAAIGYDRVGLRLSPGAYLNEMVGDEKDALVFQYLLQELNRLPIAYIHTGNFDDSKEFPELGQMTMTAFLREYYKGTIIACGGYTFARVNQGLVRGDFDAVALGRPFIANPDLITRLLNNEPIQSYDASMLATLS